MPPRRQGNRVLIRNCVVDHLRGVLPLKKTLETLSATENWADSMGKRLQDR